MRKNGNTSILGLISRRPIYTLVDGVNEKKPSVALVFVASEVSEPSVALSLSTIDLLLINNSASDVHVKHIS